MVSQLLIRPGSPLVDPKIADFDDRCACIRVRQFDIRLTRQHRKWSVGEDGADRMIRALIEPNWTLLFSKKRGRWWVRLLACGRYHHVKAIAYLPAMRAWLFYDVKFNGTRLMLAREGDPGTRAFLHDYLDSCDLVAMPRLPIPKRVAAHAGFWCTLAMKHLVGIRTGALRPDRLWRDSVAAGGRPYEISPYESSPYESSPYESSPYESGLGEGSSEAAPSTTLLPGPQPSDSVLTFLKAHAQTAIDAIKQPTWLDDAAFGRQRSELVELLHARIRALRNRAATRSRGRPYAVTTSARC
jgi:hypothetical protein